MTEIYLHFLFTHYRLFGNAPVAVLMRHESTVCFLIFDLSMRRAHHGDPYGNAPVRVRVHIIGHLQPCITEIYLHIFARMADYMDTPPHLHVARVGFGGAAHMAAAVVGAYARRTTAR